MPSEHPMLLGEAPPPKSQQVIQIGEFTISHCPHGGYWIYHDSGEGGQFSAESLAALIAKFYEDNF